MLGRRARSAPVRSPWVVSKIASQLSPLFAHVIAGVVEDRVRAEVTYEIDRFARADARHMGAVDPVLHYDDGCRWRSGDVRRRQPRRERELWRVESAPLAGVPKASRHG
jgi:hypothetical protein